VSNVSTQGQLPGAVWRFLAHQPDSSLELQNEGIFDELVVDDWLHIEQMDHSQWWMRIGDAQVFVTVQSDGKSEVNITRGVYSEVHGETTLNVDSVD
jgi:hypothetical protein